MKYLYLDKINSPKDIKHLNINLLNKLAFEIRDFLIKKISQTGGHLASNLGIVELTLALHYVFNSPKDKFIFDVGHQAYVHKILTGRKNNFDSLRQFNGMSGFPNSDESIHDVFNVGHSSTSISAALGFCITRDLEKKDYNIISIIGDGAMTGGLAFEALNNAGKSNTNIKIILNDNQMSISENVGAISKHLDYLRTQPFYLNAKCDINNFLDKMPMGSNIKKFLERTKGSLKYFVYHNIIFEELGFKYIGPIDGHDINKLIDILELSKKISGPVLIHVKTIKGKGYKKAESAPAKFHGTEAFDIETGSALKIKIWDSYSDVFGKALSNLAELNKKIIAITAAMPSGTGLSEFKNKYNNRFVDVGIAEEHAVTFAAGIAKNNFIPVVAIYSSFLQRAYDQILHDVCLQNLHVVFAIDRAGIIGADGKTHQGLFDISFLSHIPNMTIMAPKNKFELIKMLDYAINKFNAPIAIRYPRGAASRILKDYDQEIMLGEPEIINSGEKIVLVAFGSMIEEMLNVFDLLKQKNYNPGFINARFAKPISKNFILELNKYDYIFTAEENVKSGGFAQNLLNTARDFNIKLKNFYEFALPDEFIEHGERLEILYKYNLDAKSIFNKIIKLLLED